MNLRFTPAAQTDLAEIHSYIANRNRAAADRVVGRILDSIALLRDFPLLGRTGRVPGTREWYIPGTRYFSAYRIADSTVEIVAIIHTSRKWP